MRLGIISIPVWALITTAAVSTAGNALNLYDTTNQNELRTAYTDTPGDLALGLAGSAVAALATVSLF